MFIHELLNLNESCFVLLLASLFPHQTLPELYVYRYFEAPQVVIISWIQV